LSRSESICISRRLTIIAAGALCFAAAGTAAAVSCQATPSASAVRADDMFVLHSVSRDRVAQPVQLASLRRQEVIIQAAHRAAAAHAASVARAARVAAERAAAERAARVAVEQAAAATQRAAAQRVAAQRVAAQQAAAQQPVAQQAPSGSPQQIADQMLAQYGWAGQFSCLAALWERESGWNVYAENPTSGAYGIPQSLPAGRMASAGPDWRSDAATQIRWGLTYIQGRYGSPCAAWSHEQAVGWY